MIDLSRVEKYYVACGYTDMRRGIDGLAAIQQLFPRSRREQKQGCRAAEEREDAFS